jgi:hypothetical protein
MLKRMNKGHLIEHSNIDEETPNNHNIAPSIEYVFYNNIQFTKHVARMLMFERCQRQRANFIQGHELLHLAKNKKNAMRNVSQKVFPLFLDADHYEGFVSDETIYYRPCERVQIIETNHSNMCSHISKIKFNSTKGIIQEAFVNLKSYKILTEIQAIAYCAYQGQRNDSEIPDDKFTKMARKLFRLPSTIILSPFDFDENGTLTLTMIDANDNAIRRSKIHHDHQMHIEVIHNYWEELKNHITYSWSSAKAFFKNIFSQIFIWILILLLIIVIGYTFGKFLTTWMGRLPICVGSLFDTVPK